MVNKKNTAKEFSPDGKSSKKTGNNGDFGDWPTPPKKTGSKAKQADKEIRNNKKGNKKSIRTRFFSGVWYPESCADGFERLDFLGLPYVVSPLHDSDINYEGEDGLTAALDAYMEKHPESTRSTVAEEMKKSGKYLKKAHYHYLVVFEKPLSFEGAFKLLSKVFDPQYKQHQKEGKPPVINRHMLQPLKDSVRHLMLYFTHESVNARLDGKHVYDQADIVRGNHFNEHDYYDYTPEDKRMALRLTKYLIWLDTMVTPGIEDFNDKDIRFIPTPQALDKLVHIPDQILVWLDGVVLPKLLLFKDQLSKKPKLTWKEANHRLYLTTRLVADDTSKEDRDAIAQELYQMPQVKVDQKQLVAYNYRWVCKLIDFAKEIKHLLEIDQFPDPDLFALSYQAYRNTYIDYFKESYEELLKRKKIKLHEFDE